MSRFSVTLLDEAVEDIRIGKLFYEGSEAGIGSYFVDSALADVASLRLYAGIHSVHFGCHRMLLKRFPFAVYYQMNGNEVRVIAILDMRRNPEGIRAILERRGGRPDVG